MVPSARNGFGFVVFPANEGAKASGEHSIGEIEVDDHELLDDEPPSQSRPSSAGLLGARAKASVSACASVDHSLRDLLRTVQFLAASLQGACGTNAGLLRELESLDGTLEHQAKDYRGLFQRITELEAELRDVERRARDERRFLIAEQDAFLAVLVAEHERALKQLEDRLAKTEIELSAARSRLDSD